MHNFNFLFYLSYGVLQFHSGNVPAIPSLDTLAWSARNFRFNLYRVHKWTTLTQQYKEKWKTTIGS